MIPQKENKLVACHNFLHQWRHFLDETSDKGAFFGTVIYLR